MKSRRHALHILKRWDETRTKSATRKVALRLDAYLDQIDSGTALWKAHLHRGYAYREPENQMRKI
jgi:hypothetical protein